MTLGATLVGLWTGNWDFAYAWTSIVVACNGFFVFWFGLLALLRLASQRGSVDLTEVSEISDGEESSDDDDDGCRTGL
jgi:hypothetical protein